MYVVLGAGGHVGGATTRALLAAGEKVIAVIHNASKAADLRDAGAEPVQVDVRDSTTLCSVFRRGRRAFLLNPPADVSDDTDRVETATANAITAALQDSGLEKIVVASTYGAQPGEAIGDLSVLYEFERQALTHDIPTAINRAAYYFSNFDTLLTSARDGELPTMFRADIVLPMVAPEDVGRAAARQLRSGADEIGVRYVEGPARYSFADVAAAFSRALDRKVIVSVTPRDGWVAAFKAQGFSDAAAHAYANMTEVSTEGFELPDHFDRGTITLDKYIDKLVATARE